MYGSDDGAKSLLIIILCLSAAVLTIVLIMDAGRERISWCGDYHKLMGPSIAYNDYCMYEYTECTDLDTWETYPCWDRLNCTYVKSAALHQCEAASNR